MMDQDGIERKNKRSSALVRIKKRVSSVLRPLNLHPVATTLLLIGSMNPKFFSDPAVELNETVTVAGLTLHTPDQVGPVSPVPLPDLQHFK